jgi:hypothetical protein
LTTKSIDERNTTMADTPSMTSLEFARKALREEHGDFLKEAVAMAAAQLMEAESRLRSVRRAVRSRRSRARRIEVVIARGRGRRGWVRSSWGFPRSARAVGAYFPVVR